MLAHPTESVLVEPEDSSRGGAHDQQHKHPLQDAEASEYQQDGIPGEYWTGHERVGEGQIRCDDLRGGDPCPRVSEEDGDSSPTAQRRWTDIPKNPSPSWKFTQWQTPLATTRPSKSSSSTLWWQKTRSSRMQRSTRRSWPSSTRNIDWSTAARVGTLCLGQCVTSFRNSGNTGGHFLPRCHRALQGWKRRTPPRSRDPHVWCTWTVFILEFFAAGAPENGHFPAVDGDVSLQAPYMARHSGPSFDAALASRTRKEIRGRWKSDRSVASIRAGSTAPQIVPPSGSGLPSLCPEMRKRVAQGDFRLHSRQPCPHASRSVNQFLPRRPRGANFVVLSSGAFSKLDEEFGSVVSLLVGIISILESTYLRRLRCDVRTGRVLGAVLRSSCAFWSHCRDSHAGHRCSDVWVTRTLFVSHSDWQRHFKRLPTLIQD